MLNLVRNNFLFYLLFLPLYIGSSFVLSVAPLLIGGLGLLWFIIKGRYEYVVFTFFLTLILANNKAPEFASYETLRIVFVVAMTGLSTLIIFRDKGLDRRILYFLPFFVIALISSWLFSPQATNSIIKVVSYLLLVVTIFEFVRYVLEISDYRLYEHLILLIAVTVIISLLGRFLYPSVFVIAGRLNGVMGNPNFLALYCVIAYPLVDHFKVSTSEFKERSLNVLKLFIVLCLFLTGSRNGYTSLILYIMFTMFLFRGISGKTVSAFIALGAIFAFIQIEALTELLPFLRDFIRPHTLETASGRSVVWAVALDEILRQPWMGGGFEYYSYYMNDYKIRYNLEGVFWHGVWNSYLAFLLDTGIVGLSAYLVFITGVIKQCSNLKIIIPYLGVIIFTAIFEAWAVSSLNPITPLFLLFLLIISIHGSRYENFSIA